jgi:hypothetical protein
LDIDDNTSHVEGSTNVMSAGETESDSETEIVEQESEFSETAYIHTPEDEFGAVSIHKYLFIKKKLMNCFHFRLASKLRSLPKSIKV